MDLDPLWLSRLQFALTIGFHFLFPPLTIGLAWLLVLLEWRGWRGGDEDYIRAGRFFGRILGLTFALGVASGVVMEFQFGTNWAEYSKYVGDIFGAPLAAEGVFAFFLESAFLGLYLFGRDRVSKGTHWFACLMVAVGATISAFWIIVANSWQQTPAGYEVQAGRAELTSFWAAALNPSVAERFTHTLVACLLAGAFLMAGVSAYLLLRGQAANVARKTLRVSVIAGFVWAVVTLYPTGHHHAKQVARTQPEKFAAMEGLVRGRTKAPLLLFGKPSGEPPKVEYVLEISGMLSWLAFGDPNVRIAGIEDLQAAGRPTPPFIATFVSFHTMVGLGFAFILLMAIGVLLLWRKRLYDTRWYLKLLIWAIPFPLITCQFGWIVAEVGRQPWVVYGLLKTADAHSTNVTGGEVLFSLLMFSAIYVALGALYVFMLVRKVKRGPAPLPAQESGSWI